MTGTPDGVLEPYRIHDCVEVWIPGQGWQLGRITVVRMKALDVCFEDGRTEHVGKHRAKLRLDLP